MKPVNLAKDLQDWDKTIISPLRFTIMTLINEADAIGFADIRHATETTPQALSKQVTILENAGYLTVSKIARGRRVLTEISITKQGKEAFTRQLTILRQITRTP